MVYAVPAHRPAGQAPAMTPFVKPLGLDFIVTAEGQTLLVELQHGFGRRGLRRLFPEANRAFRRRYRTLLQQRERNEPLQQGLRRICGDKGRTYRLFADYQPATLVMRRWNESTVRWLSELSSPLVLAKPPQGSCGRGIRVYDRQALLRAGQPALPATRPLLLQQYVMSRSLLDDEGRRHVGCIRHVVLMDHDGEQLTLDHLPSYWRVSPAPCGPTVDAESLTANISRGAFTAALTAREEQAVQEMSDEIWDPTGSPGWNPSAGLSIELARSSIPSPLACPRTKAGPDQGPMMTGAQNRSSSGKWTPDRGRQGQPCWSSSTSRGHSKAGSMVR